MFNLERKIQLMLVDELVERANNIIDTEEFPLTKKDEDGEVIPLFVDCTDILTELQKLYGTVNEPRGQFGQKARNTLSTAVLLSSQIIRNSRGVFMATSLSEVRCKTWEGTRYMFTIE